VETAQFFKVMLLVGLRRKVRRPMAQPSFSGGGSPMRRSPPAMTRLMGKPWVLVKSEVMNAAAGASFGDFFG